MPKKFIGPPLHRNNHLYHHHQQRHHHHYHHRQHNFQNAHHPCSHVHHACRYHNNKNRQHNVQGRTSCLSPLISRQADPNDLSDSAPHASPEVSDIDLQNTPRRLVGGNVNSGSLLRVPSVNNTCNDYMIEVSIYFILEVVIIMLNEKCNFQGSWSGSSFLSPPSLTEQRRKSSVMFCDEVTTLNSTSEAKNICSSEKMTQTDDGDLWQHNKNNSSDNQVPKPQPLSLLIPKKKKKNS